MNTRNVLDRESFERFLANAVAVQKSGLDRRSLSIVVDIEQFIASDEFALDRAMQMIAERLHTLFKASGTAIALLDSNELVYRAGAGGAATEIGRRVAAILSVCPHDVRREILRVENAAADTRIEAEICRQFGATSLLMLPICENQVLAGVLDVRFDGAHSFTQQEIRVCRLMIGALEEGIGRHLRYTEVPETPGAHERAHDEQVRSERVSPHHDLQPAEGALPSTPIPVDAVVQNVFQGQNLTSKGDRFSYPAVVIRKVGSLWTNLRTAIRSTAITTWSERSWLRVGAVVCVAAFLGILTWVSHVARPAVATQGLPVPTQLNTVQPASATPLAASDRSHSLTNRHHESTGLGPQFRRVRVSPNEVDYIADDVIIRQFTTSHPKPQPRGVKEVNLGDDVTIRYFAQAAPPVTQRPATPQIGPCTNRPGPPAQ